MTGYSKKEVLGLTPRVGQGAETVPGVTGRIRKAL